MKQRLVGTLVLGSLALILIPLLLDGEGVERPPLSANIPPAPVIDTAPLPEPTRPDILADTLPPVPDDVATAPAVDAEDAAPLEPSDASAAPPADSAAADNTAAAPTPNASVARADPEPDPEPAEEPIVRSATTPALDAAGLPETWAVRVGVFGNKANAERLTAGLAADGYRSFIRPLGVSSGVYIGPVATRDEAASIQQKVNAAKAKYQVDNVIVQRFDIGQE